MQESFEDRYNPDPILNLDADFISVECLEKLGLDENPFIDHARDPFLFIDEQLEMSINVLMDYLQNQNSTLVLLGEIGIGKTTQLRALLRKGYQHFNFCTLRAKPKTSFADVEKKIQERWRLPEQDIDETLQIDEYIKRYIETDKHPVLIIDDAHRLQNQVLDALLQLKHRVGLQSPQALGLVLASEPSIQTQLAELEQINPAATQIYQINARAFDATQCENYINYRLKKAGAIDGALFTPEQIQEFYTKSQGLPRIINKLAREALSKQCQQNSQSTTSAFKFASNPSMRLGLILAGLIGLAFIIGTLSKKPPQDVELDLKKTEMEHETKPKEVVELDTETSSETEISSEFDNQTAPIIKPQEISKPYVAPLVLAPLQIENKVDTKVIQEQTTKNKSEVQTEPFTPDWLLKQKPDTYTIQIVASPSQENLFAFAKKHLEGKQTAYYQKSGQNKQWFILVYGIFPTREEALTTIDALPPSLQKNQPYPLQINKIQQVIRQ